MKRVVRVSVIGVTAGVVALGGALIAHAGSGWAVPGKSLKLKIRVEDMPRGVTPSVAKVGPTAVVSWSAQEIGPDVKMQSYVVTAHSVEEPTRPDVTHTVAADGGGTESITFAAGEVAGGKWYWTLVPKFHSWIGAESKKSDKLAFPAAAPAARPAASPASPTPTAIEPTATTATAAPEHSPTSEAPKPVPTESPSESAGPLPPPDPEDTSAH